MVVTLLIGNGFDKAIGLETGYDAFYEWYCKLPINDLPRWIVDFREEIDKYVKKHLMQKNIGPMQSMVWGNIQKSLH